MNKSLHPNISVETTESERTVLIKAGDDMLLSVTARDDESAVVNNMDLRPIGLNIVGDGNGLQIGGSSLSGNIFSGVDTIIGLG